MGAFCCPSCFAVYCHMHFLDEPDTTHKVLLRLTYSQEMMQETGLLKTERRRSDDLSLWEAGDKVACSKSTKNQVVAMAELLY